jgi:hypothetical protein
MTKNLFLKDVLNICHERNTLKCTRVTIRNKRDLSPFSQCTKNDKEKEKQIIMIKFCSLSVHGSPNLQKGRGTGKMLDDT